MKLHTNFVDTGLFNIKGLNIKTFLTFLFSIFLDLENTQLEVQKKI